MTTVLTLALDAVSQARFESLRQAHYPAGLNRIPAHLTLFHQLPGTEEVGAMLKEVADRRAAFRLHVTGVRSLDRGVAYTINAPELLSLHAELAEQCGDWLTAQDRQRFAPHVVVQNKAPGAEARELLKSLQERSLPEPGEAVGLAWWEYLGGPWRPLEVLPFRGAAAK